MATSNPLATLETFLQGYPTIEYIAPSSEEFAAASKVFQRSRSDKPSAIVQPQSPEDVVALIKFAKSNEIPFTLRTGGHNLEGLTLVQDVLLIDLTALNFVTVADDRKSATVGGGILQGDLAKKLWDEGVATATGNIPTVGYFGWASYGGYGPFSANWGLGVDNIIGATVVNPNGDIVKIGPNDPLLKGIRGAGGAFGVVLDITVNVYPAPSLLAGPIIFDSSDITKSYIDVNAAYRNLQAEGLPPQLTIQSINFNSPHGLAFAFLFAWSGTEAELEEGQRWSQKIASLGPAKMNMVVPTTIPDWIAGAGANVPDSVYGSSWTHNVSSLSPEVVEAIAINLARLPNVPGPMCSVHQVRGPSAKPQELDSIFGPREPHFMLEVLGFPTQPEDEAACKAWGAVFSEELEKASSESGVLLPKAYVSLYTSAHAGSGDEWAKKAFGDAAGELRDLKTSFDPENLFKHTVPSFSKDGAGLSYTLPA